MFKYFSVTVLIVIFIDMHHLYIDHILHILKDFKITVVMMRNLLHQISLSKLGALQLSSPLQILLAERAQQVQPCSQVMFAILRYMQVRS